MVEGTRRGCSPHPSFLPSALSRLARFAALPRAERRLVYAGWWDVIKKEAKHYWVGGWVWGWVEHRMLAWGDSPPPPPSLCATRWAPSCWLLT